MLQVRARVSCAARLNTFGRGPFCVRASAGVLSHPVQYFKYEFGVEMREGGGTGSVNGGHDCSRLRLGCLRNLKPTDGSAEMASGNQFWEFRVVLDRCSIAAVSLHFRCSPLHPPIKTYIYIYIYTETSAAASLQHRCSIAAFRCFGRPRLVSASGASTATQRVRVCSIALHAPGVHLLDLHCHHWSAARPVA